MLLTPHIGLQCLPADALLTVLEEDGATSVRPAASVSHGTQVLTSAGYSPIYLFSHYAPHAITPMRRLETMQGYAVELSPLHYIEEQGAGAMFAKDIALGHVLSVRDADGMQGWATVTKASTVYKRGLFSPFTLQGDLVVATHRNTSNGIVVSDQSEWFAEGYLPTRYIPTLYHGLLAPVRGLFALDPAWVRSARTTGS